MAKTKKNSGIQLVVPIPTVKLSDLFSITRGQNPAKKHNGVEAQVNLIAATGISSYGHTVASVVAKVKCLPSFLEKYSVEKYDVIVQARSENLKVGVFEGRGGLANGSVYILRLKVGVSEEEKRKWAAAVCISLSAQKAALIDTMLVMPNKNNQVSKYLPTQKIGDIKIVTDIDAALELMLQERQSYNDFVNQTSMRQTLILEQLNRK